MKKILSVFCITTLLFASCSDEYDDSKLWQNVNDLKDRIASLEKTVQTMNSDISSIQSIIDAINARDYIVKVDELADKSGYTITFAKGNTITIKHGKDGINGKDSPIIGIDIYEGVYYWTITTNGTKTWLVDNDGNKLKVSGVDGKTAFDLAVEKGYKGTLDEWLESLKGSNGSDGQDGSNGKSAYELAVDRGYTGTLEEWLLSLNGTNGSNGKSAYELAVEKGYKGTLEQWLESLKGSNGSDGQNGQDGSNGKSAYELAVDNGYTGTIEEWLESLNGTNGKDGSDGENGIDGTTPILGIDSDGYWTIDKGNGIQRLKDANGQDVKAIGHDGTDGKDGQNGNDGDSFFSNVTYDDNAVYFTLSDGKIISIPLSKGVSFTITGVSVEQSFEYGETRTFNVVQNNIAKISISKPDGWRVSVHGDVLTVIAPPQENTFAEENGEIAITAMGTDSKSFILFSFAVYIDPNIHFEDPNFEKYILEHFDKDKDGFISQLEANEITSISCQKMGIESVAEIKYFPNLKYLNCNYNQLGSLNVSMCRNLIELYCYYNRITNLDVNECANLTMLRCFNNKLISLDVSKCTSLTNLDCESNQLVSLNAEGCTCLTSVGCHYNQLTSLNINECRKLERLNCFSNRLTSLNVSECTNLSYLDCCNNQLINLDINGCINLSYLDCYNNQLISLVGNGCTSLTELKCGSNRLKSLNVIECTSLTNLSCYVNQLTTLNVSKNTSLIYLSCWDNLLTSLDVSNCRRLSGLDCKNNPNLESIYFNTLHSISNLAKDDHTQIIYK